MRKTINQGIQEGVKAFAKDYGICSVLKMDKKDRKIFKKLKWNDITGCFKIMEKC